MKRENSSAGGGAPWSVKDGFRLRGIEMTRTETFTDAAFAFAVTLLVISIDKVPGDYDEMIEALKGLPAFAASFALLLMFWGGHWRWSRRFGLEDAPSVFLSLGLVFLTLCYVYPLKYLSSLFMHWVSGGAVSSGASVSTMGQLHMIFAIYGAGFVLMSLLMILLNVHALRCGEGLRLNSVERLTTRVEIEQWGIFVGFGIVSVALALLTTPRPMMWPGWAYMPLAVVMPLHAWWRGRSIRGTLTVAAGA